MRKILFLCLGNPFSTEMKYKDNYMIRAAVESGHETCVVATEKQYSDGVETDVPEGCEQIDGYTLIRIKNKKIGGRILSDKIRYTPGLLQIVLDFAPDLIFYNCPQIYNINDLCVIKKRIPNAIIIWDFSTWYGNSGKTWLSLNLLHRIIYRSWLICNQKYVDKIYYTADDPHIFIREVYGLDERKMALHDLPGELIDLGDKKTYRKRIQNEFNFSDENTVFVHTGKLDVKKKTIELLHAFSKCDEKSFRLLIIGSLSDEIKDEASSIIESDKRIFYLGFMRGEDMIQYIRGCDIYLQPGSTSQTLNDAVCAGCAIAYRNRNYDNNLIGEYGWRFDCDRDIDEFFLVLAKDLALQEKIKLYSEKMIEKAKNRLDYRILYERMWD